MNAESFTRKSNCKQSWDCRDLSSYSVRCYFIHKSPTNQNDNLYGEKLHVDNVLIRIEIIRLDENQRSQFNMTGITIRSPINIARQWLLNWKLLSTWVLSTNRTGQTIDIMFVNWTIIELANEDEQFPLSTTVERRAKRAPEIICKTTSHSDGICWKYSIWNHLDLRMVIRITYLLVNGTKNNYLV